MVNMKVTKWKPDTCGCVLQYDWDKDLPPTSRSHSLYNIVEKCTEHSSLSDADTWTNALDQNQRKNYAIDEVGASSVESWSYTGTGSARVLHLVTDLKGGAKSQAQSDVDARFGSGKVVIE